MANKKLENAVTFNGKRYVKRGDKYISTTDPTDILLASAVLSMATGVAESSSYPSSGSSSDSGSSSSGDFDGCE